eukprot:Rmarinus@m.2648
MNTSEQVVEDLFRDIYSLEVHEIDSDMSAVQGEPLSQVSSKNIFSAVAPISSENTSWSQSQIDEIFDPSLRTQTDFSTCVADVPEENCQLPATYKNSESGSTPTTEASEATLIQPSPISGATHCSHQENKGCGSGSDAGRPKLGRRAKGGINGDESAIMCSGAIQSVSSPIREKPHKAKPLLTIKPGGNCASSTSKARKVSSSKLLKGQTGLSVWLEGVGPIRPQQERNHGSAGTRSAEVKNTRTCEKEVTGCDSEGSGASDGTSATSRALLVKCSNVPEDEENPLNNPGECMPGTGGCCKSTSTHDSGSRQDEIRCNRKKNLCSSPTTCYISGSSGERDTSTSCQDIVEQNNNSAALRGAKQTFESSPSVDLPKGQSSEPACNAKTALSHPSLDGLPPRDCSRIKLSLASRSRSGEPKMSAGAELLDNCLKRRSHSLVSRKEYPPKSSTSKQACIDLLAAASRSLVGVHNILRVSPKRISSPVCCKSDVEETEVMLGLKSELDRRKRSRIPSKRTPIRVKKQQQQRISRPGSKSMLVNSLKWEEPDILSENENDSGQDSHYSMSGKNYRESERTPPIHRHKSDYVAAHLPRASLENPHKAEIRKCSEPKHIPEKPKVQRHIPEKPALYSPNVLCSWLSDHSKKKGTNRVL